LKNPASSILEIDRLSALRSRARDFPRPTLTLPLAGSLIPWIDKDLGNGQSREEWKAAAEANKSSVSRRILFPIEASASG